MHRSNLHLCSITSSARESSVGAMLWPSAVGANGVSFRKHCPPFRGLSAGRRHYRGCEASTEWPAQTARVCWHPLYHRKSKPALMAG
jgi:hypothetical protein